MQAGAAKPGTTILFFVRGKGRGHAVPASSIARAVQRARPDLHFAFVSYAAGAETLRQLGHPVLDLGLDEDSPPWDIINRATTILSRGGCKLALIFEEFALPPVAKGFGVRNLFLTDFFPPEETLIGLSLRYSDEILFLDEAGRSDVPAYLRDRLFYLGVIFRPLDTPHRTRALARNALDIGVSSVVVLAAPGGARFHSETRAPIFDLVAGAFDRIESAEKLLVWVVGGEEHASLAPSVAGRRDIRLLKPHWDFTPTMLASDIVITKGNRMPLFECEILGIPSISISYGLNPVDDSRVAQIPTNTALRARGLDSIILHSHIERTLARGPFPRQDLRGIEARLDNVARRILINLEKAAGP